MRSMKSIAAVLAASLGAACPSSPRPETQADEITATGTICDNDLDDDGIDDDLDNCPGYPTISQSDIDTDGIGDACDDSDGDGFSDGIEIVAGTDPQDPCSYPGAADDDQDGVPNCRDNCGRWNADQLDVDEDGLGDLCDTDDDGDGISASDDNCPSTYNPDQADEDSDGVGDACDDDDEVIDTDGDGVPDPEDNCPGIANPDQSDNDADGIGDACDPVTPPDCDVGSAGFPKYCHEEY